MKTRLLGSSVVTEGGSPIGFLFLFVYSCRNLLRDKTKASINKEQERGERATAT